MAKSISAPQKALTVQGQYPASGLDHKQIRAIDELKHPDA
jgi:hypothetical protein